MWTINFFSISIKISNFAPKWKQKKQNRTRQRLMPRQPQ